MSKKQHDPLCPVKDGEPCKCDLIAKVEVRTEDRMYEEWWGPAPP